MNDQGNGGQCLDRADAGNIQPAFLVLLQMHIPDRDRHRIHPGFPGELRGLLRVCSRRSFAFGIADKADLSFARDPGRMGHFRHHRRFRDILRQGFARPVKHQRGKATVQRLAAFIQRVAVIQMRHDRNRRAFGQMPEHLAQHRQRRMRAAGRPGLQDHGTAFGFSCGDIGAHVFPAKGDKPRHGVMAFQRGLQDVGKGGKGHLNFATISLMPGIVST